MVAAPIEGRPVVHLPSRRFDSRPNGELDGTVDRTQFAALSGYESISRLQNNSEFKASFSDRACARDCSGQVRPPNSGDPMCLALTSVTRWMGLHPCPRILIYSIRWAIDAYQGVGHRRRSNPPSPLEYDNKTIRGADMLLRPICVRRYRRIERPAKW